MSWRLIACVLGVCSYSLPVGGKHVLDNNRLSQSLQINTELTIHNLLCSPQRCQLKPGSSEPGYAGTACQQILCDPQCMNGECIEYVRHTTSCTWLDAGAENLLHAGQTYVSVEMAGQGMTVVRQSAHRESSVTGSNHRPTSGGRLGVLLVSPQYSCNGEHGNCTGPEICTCESGYFGNSCARRCTCVNGVCNDGE